MTLIHSVCIYYDFSSYIKNSYSYYNLTKMAKSTYQMVHQSVTEEMPWLTWDILFKLTHKKLYLRLLADVVTSGHLP